MAAVCEFAARFSFFSPLLQEADELIVGLPVSADGSETPQSNKVRSVVGRLAVQAADRCVALRVAAKLQTALHCSMFSQSVWLPCVNILEEKEFLLHNAISRTGLC